MHRQAFVLLLSIVVLLTSCSGGGSHGGTGEAKQTIPSTTATPKTTATTVRRPPRSEPTATKTTRASRPPTTERKDDSRDSRGSGVASGGQRACVKLKGLLGQVHTVDDLYSTGTRARLTSILDQIVVAKDLSLLYQSSFVRDALQTSQNPALPQVLSQLYEACVQNGYVTR